MFPVPKNKRIMIENVLSKKCPYYTKTFRIQEESAEVWVNYCEYRNEPTRCGGRIKKIQEFYVCSKTNFIIGNDNLVKHLDELYSKIREMRTG